MSQPTSTIEPAEETVTAAVAPAGTPLDASLVLRAQAGDESARGDLAVQARPLVQRYARRLLSDPVRAEDVAQTALMKAFARLGDVRAPEAFQAWLLRIVRNECLNELARRKHAQLPLSSLGEGATEIEAPAGGEDDPEEALLRSQLQALVRRVAATLPAHHRQALVMRALEDRPYEEIAEALDVPVSVVRVWYFRARKRFRVAFVQMMVARRGVPAPCQEMAEAIAEMIEGTLPTADRPRVENHLGGCHVCRQTEDELRNTAFRTPSRGMVIGLGLLRLGWRLPRRLRDGLAHAPRLTAKLALGAGGAALAVSVAASSGTPQATATTAAPAVGIQTGLPLAGGSTGATDPAATGPAGGGAAGTPGAGSPLLPALPTLSPTIDLAPVIQQLDSLAAGLGSLGSSTVGQSDSALSRGAASAGGAVASLAPRPPATPTPQPLPHPAP